jgi:hypothetical protein
MTVFLTEYFSQAEYMTQIRFIVNRQAWKSSVVHFHLLNEINHMILFNYLNHLKHFYNVLRKFEKLCSESK